MISQCPTVVPDFRTLFIPIISVKFNSVFWFEYNFPSGIVSDCGVEKTPVGQIRILSSYYEYSQEFAGGAL